MSDPEELQLPTSFDPFADAVAADGGASKKYVHLRTQQRNGRKTLTTVEGLAEDLDHTKILRKLKEDFCCNGHVAEDKELGKIIQLQGDERRKVAGFLARAGIVDKDLINVHGF